MIVTIEGTGQSPVIDELSKSAMVRGYSIQIVEAEAHQLIDCRDDALLFDHLVICVMAGETPDPYVSLVLSSLGAVRETTDASWDERRQLIAQARQATAKAQCLRKFPGYIGTHAPEFLIVDDCISAEPAEPPFSHDGSAFLIASLATDSESGRTYGLCDVSDGTDVWGLHEALRYPTIVALGRQGQFAMRRWGMEYVEAPHPAWVEKFHPDAQVEYGRSLLHPDLTLRIDDGGLVTTPK